MKDHLVAALVHPPFSAFEAGCVVEIFGVKRQELADIQYKFALGGLEPGIVTASNG